LEVVLPFAGTSSPLEDAEILEQSRVRADAPATDLQALCEIAEAHRPALDDEEAEDASGSARQAFSLSDQSHALDKVLDGLLDGFGHDKAFSSFNSFNQY
jgi:hypothetical protein